MARLKGDSVRFKAQPVGTGDVCAVERQDELLIVILLGFVLCCSLEQKRVPMSAPLAHLKDVYDNFREISFCS